MTSRLIALVLALAVLVGAALYLQDISRVQQPGAPSRTVNLTLVTGGSTPYWQTIANGAKAAAEKLDANLTVLMPEQDEDSATQIKMLLEIDPGSVDGVAVSPLDAEQQTRLINRLSEDAFVVTFDSDAPLSLRSQYIGASNWAAGKQCAELVKEAAPDGGRVAAVLANLTKHNTQQRKAGFEETLAESTDTEGESSPTYELVDIRTDDGDKETCAEQVKQILDQHPDLVCLVGMNSYHGAVLVETLREAGKLGEIKLVTFDDVEETLQGVEDGAIFATVAQDPYHYGFEAVRCLTRLCGSAENQRPLPGSPNTVTISTQAVRQDNLEQFRQMQRELAGTAESEPAGKKTEAKE